MQMVLRFRRHWFNFSSQVSYIYVYRSANDDKRQVRHSTPTCQSVTNLYAVIHVNWNIKRWIVFGIKIGIKHKFYSMCLHFKPNEKNSNFRAILVSYAQKNKAWIMLSTQHQDLDIDIANSNKPQIIIDYNKWKGGVDTFDKILVSMNCYRGTNRYSLCIFYNMISCWCTNKNMINDQNWEQRKFIDTRQSGGGV